VQRCTVHFFEKTKNFKIMGDIGITEILLILVVVVLLFGGKKIPELMKGIGEGMKEFKKASRIEDEPASSALSAESAENKYKSENADIRVSENTVRE
jgi:sec-independent protein translocase protein TatA